LSVCTLEKGDDELENLKKFAARTLAFYAFPSIDFTTLHSINSYSEDEYVEGIRDQIAEKNILNLFMQLVLNVS
jgi:hypothetical protein